MARACCFQCREWLHLHTATNLFLPLKSSTYFAKARRWLLFNDNKASPSSSQRQFQFRKYHHLNTRFNASVPEKLKLLRKRPPEREVVDSFCCRKKPLIDAFTGEPTLRTTGSDPAFENTKKPTLA